MRVRITRKSRLVQERRETGMAAKQRLSSGELVLIVEDDALVGLFLADSLEDQGYRIAGPLGGCRETLRWLEAHTPDVCILDVALRDGNCIELARTLRSRGIPFVIFSGHAQRRDDPIEYGGAPWVGKPAQVEHLVEALRALTPHPFTQIAAAG